MSEQDELVMLRDAVQATNNVVLLTDPGLPDNPIIYVNKGFEKLTGYARDEVLGRNCRFLQGDDHDQEGVAQLRKAIAKCESVQVELRNYRKDGSFFWNELYITPVFRDGKLVNFMGVQNDITARKMAETSQLRFMRAVESASDAIMITEAKLEQPGPRIEYVNRAFTRMTGYRADEIIGKTPRILQGSRTDRTVLQRLKRRLEAGKDFEGEAINYRKDGSAFVLHWTTSPIRNADGEIVNWVAVQHDVTERRRLERETLNISAREQRRIAGDLHDALQQQLVGTAFRARLHAQSLARRGDEGTREAEELYELIQESIQNLRDVIKGVIPVQANENGLMVALEELCSRTRELYGLDCAFSYEEPLQLSDRELATQLYYIAQEAVANATKHAKASLVEISLGRTNGHIALTVRDDGEGFDAELEGFQHGMGLHLMAYRARLVEADFEVVSSPGAGTSVRCVFLPV